MTRCCEEMPQLYNDSPTPYLLLVDFRYGEPTGSDLMAAGLQSMLLGDSDPAARVRGPAEGRLAVVQARTA